MLVLTRSKNQTILIGDNVKVTILKTGTSVRVGVEAPRDVPVVREELEQRESAAA